MTSTQRTFPRHIFKAYDIRGLADQEVTGEMAEKIGRAYVALLRREGLTTSLQIVVGRDMRASSVRFEERLIQGLVRSGVRVLSVGLVSTPAFYFSVGHLKAHGGIMVSASHNPAAYNGFKITRERAIPVSGDTGIQEIADLAEAGVFQDAEIQGSVEDVPGIPEQSAKAEFAFAGNHPLKRLRIVADTGNGMGAQYLDQLFGLIDADVTRMYWDFDGRFPNHEADPFKPENTQALRQKVLELGADLGIATDGDGDRIFFVDHEGRLVPPAIVRGLLAQIALRTHPGAVICYDIRPGKITEDMIREAGGIPSVTRVGHSLIKEQMRAQGAVFGGESSGHFFYAFPEGIYEGPVTAATQILQEMTRRNIALADIVRPLERYAHSGEMNFTVEDKVGMMNKLKARYPDGESNELDGMTIRYPDFWFNVRASNTEPKLRLNLEAMNEAVMHSRRDEIVAFIKDNA